MKMLIAVIVFSTAMVASAASTTLPTTRGSQATPRRATAADAQGVLNGMMGVRPQEAPLVPMDIPRENSADLKVAPAPPKPATLKREGDVIFDRVGRLEKTPDGRQEFHFQADGAAMQDPPMLVQENLKLEQMEQIIKAASGHLTFRITGTVSEYGSRNYITIQKFVTDNNPLAQKKQQDTGR